MTKLVLFSGDTLVEMGHVFCIYESLILATGFCLKNLKKVIIFLEFFSNCLRIYRRTRELPGSGRTLVNILNGWIFTGKSNTHLKWNIEVLMLKKKNIWMRHNFLWNTILSSAEDFSYSFHLEWMSLTFGVITQRQRHKSKI